MDNWVQKWIYRPFSKSRSLAWPDTSSRILQEHFHSTNLILKKKMWNAEKINCLPSPLTGKGRKCWRTGPQGTWQSTVRGKMWFKVHAFARYSWQNCRHRCRLWNYWSDSITVHTWWLAWITNWTGASHATPPQKMSNSTGGYIYIKEYCLTGKRSYSSVMPGASKPLVGVQYSALARMVI